MKPSALFNSFIRPAITIVFVLFIITVIVFPVAVTIIGQVLFPYQSNGSIIVINGENRGSFIIGQDISSPKLFQPVNLNTSASLVDPDNTPQQAYAQIPRISNATAINTTNLTD